MLYPGPKNSQPSNVASSDISNHVDQHLNAAAFGDDNIPFQDLEMDSFMTNLTIPGDNIVFLKFNYAIGN